MEPNGKDLVDFWGYAVRRGLMNKDTAAGLRAAAKAVLSSVEPEGWESLDIREMDLDDFADRFERLRMSDFKPGSLAVYRKRFSAAVAAYLEFLDSPSAWSYPRTRSASSNGSEKTSQKRGRAKQRERERDTDTPVVRPNEAIPPTVIEYPYPLRPELLVTLRLPRDLTSSEAKRLASFLDSLVMEQRALPARASES